MSIRNRNQLGITSHEPEQDRRPDRQHQRSSDRIRNPLPHCLHRPDGGRQRLLRADPRYLRSDQVNRGHDGFRG